MTSMTQSPERGASGPPGEASALRPASAVACVVAVLHRCTLEDTVRVAYRDAHTEGVLSFDLSQDPTPAALSAVAEADLAALEQDRDGAEADPSVVADVRFVWDTDPGGTAPGLTVEAGPALLRATAGAGRYTAEDAERITGLLRTAHRAASADGAVPLSVLPLATADDLALVGAQAGTGRAPVPARPLHVMVQEQAERTPEAVAVSCAGAELSYRDLAAGADRLALRLQKEGVGRDRVVGVLAERSPDLVVALLAILKCGAAYAAFEPDLPARRLGELLADAGAGHVLAQDRFAASVPAGVTVLPLTPDGQETPVSPVGVDVAPTAVAYVSFTSGSTGTPKGVRVPHAAVSRLVVEPDWADFGPSDVFLQLAPVAFDASTLELWAPLVNGGGWSSTRRARSPPSSSPPRSSTRR